MPTTHTVKCLATYFGAVRRKEKNFEVRRDDRGYQRGDTMVLKEWLPELGGRYSGNEEERKIKYILTGGQFGIEPGHIVIGF